MATLSPRWKTMTIFRFRKYWLEEKDQYDGEEEQDVCDNIHALLGRGTKVRGRTLRRMDSRYWVPIIRS